MADDARLQVEISAKIDKLIDNLAKARTSIDGFSRAAYANADRVRKSLDGMNPRVDGILKSIELQNKLSLAQASGNKREAAELREEIALVNQINLLRRAGISQTEAEARAHMHLAAIKAAEAAAERAERTGSLGGAARAVFDRARFATLEEGGARIGLFGGAIEKLGVAGVATAAALATFTVAAEKASQSAEWAESIKQASERLGISTGQVQEYDFALASLGIGAEKGRESLDGLNTVVGKVEENLLRGKNGPQLRLFESILGTDSVAATQEKLKSLGGLPGILAQIQNYVAPLNAQQRGAVAKVLEIDPQVLTALAESKDKVGELIDKAHEFGLIADRDLIDKAAESAEKFHFLSTVLNDEVRGAFLGLSTPLAQAGLGFLHIYDRIADIISGARESIGPIQAMMDKLKGIPVVGAGVQGAQQPGGAAMAGKFFAGTMGGPFGATMAGLAGPTMAIVHAWEQVGHQARALDQLIADTSHREAAPRREGGAGVGNGGGGGGGGGRGARASADDRATRLAEASEQYTRALLAGANTLGREHELHLQLIDAEYALAKARADQEKDPETRKVLQATALATRDANQQGEARRYDEDITKTIEADLQAALDRTAADRKAADAADDSLLRTLGYEADRLQALAALAKTTAERKDIAERLLAIEQEEARVRLNKEARDQGSDPTAGQAALADVGAAKQAGINQQYEGPLRKFSDDAKSEDLGTTLQSSAVTAMNTLNNGLADAIVHGKSLKDTLKSALQGVEEDLIKWGLKQAESAVLGIFLPGFASGSDSAPGGWKLVGEHGVEAINTRPGARIVPNSTLAAVARASAGAGNIRSGGGPGVVNYNMTHVFSPDLKGVIGDQGLEQRLRASEARVLDAAQRATPLWLNTYQRERG